MAKNDKEKDELYAKNCEVLEIFRDKAVIKVSEDDTLIARRIGKIKKGDKVDVYKRPILDKVDEVLIYLSPLYYLFLGIVFGFLLPSNIYATYHYLFVLSLTILGFAQLFIIKNYLKKRPNAKFIALDNSIILK